MKLLSEFGVLIVGLKYYKIQNEMQIIVYKYFHSTIIAKCFVEKKKKEKELLTSFDLRLHLLL